MNGAQALFKALTDAGIDTCFANPGTSEMQLVYEIGRTDNVRAVLCLQENTVTGAADGYARMSGRPAFTLLHVGSGFANGMANLHNAGRARSMMINVVGANATYHQPRFPEHEFINGKIADIARAVSHWVREAKTADELAVLGALATREARLGAGRICTIIAPTNCHWDPTFAPPDPGPPVQTPRVPAPTIDAVAGLLQNGRKTGILLGGRTLYGEALELAGRIAAGTGAVLFGETFPPRMARGEGRVPLEIVEYIIEKAVGQLAGFEQLIMIGAQLPVSTFAYQDKPVVKVPEGCRTYTLATEEHDLTAALADLARAVSAPAEPDARMERSRPPMPAGALTPQAVGESLCLLMPENAILVDEAATMGWPIVEATRGAPAHDYMHAVCGGAIGGGLPLALGAAVACPGRKTVLVQGDGCGMYTAQALWSMARERADVTVILLRNDNYAILEVELARVRSGEATDRMHALMHLDRPHIDWVKLAEGHGVPASRAATAEELHKRLEAALAVRGPRLIEARMDQDIGPMIDLVRKGNL